MAKAAVKSCLNWFCCEYNILLLTYCASLCMNTETGLQLSLNFVYLGRAHTCSDLCVRANAAVDSQRAPAFKSVDQTQVLAPGAFTC